jgi:hypothetical protein
VRHRPLFPALLLAFPLLWATPAHAVAIPGIPSGLRWGEPSRAIIAQLGAGVTVLPRPIDFGDSYADLVLRRFSLGGVELTAFFQMDKATRGLKRIQIERQRHGVNPPAYRAVLVALAAALGAPDATCVIAPGPASGYQAAAERVWLGDTLMIRAIFRDTTIAAFEGCLGAMNPPCGLTGQMLVRISPRGEDSPACKRPARS